MHLHSTTILLFCILGMDQVRLSLTCSGFRWITSILRGERCCKDGELPKCECFKGISVAGFTGINKPQCPAKLNVRFYLYSRKVKKSKAVKSNNLKSYSGLIKKGKKVKLIIHGFLSNAFRDWAQKMKDAILKQDDVIVILVDWRKGAKPFGLPLYAQAASNTRSTGAVVAKFLTVLNKSYKVAYNDVHIIGHSMGAHVSGWAAKKITQLTGKKIGRITGLDPAGVGFENVAITKRLDKNDATFVDVIHTDSNFIGIKKNIGHVDFKPNDGYNQPGCSTRSLGTMFLNGFTEFICSHQRVVYYFINSIRQCSYFVSNKCRMGYHASKKSCLVGTIKQLRTVSSGSFCERS